MGKINQEWLAKTQERAIDPDRPIIDSHQHIWTDRFPLYIDYFGEAAPDFLLNEVGRSGHNIRATVHMTIQAAYRDDLPSEMVPVAETEFLDDVATEVAARGADVPLLAAAIVGGVDMLRGAEIAHVLDAHIAAAPTRFRGIRHPVAWHPSPLIPFKEQHAGILLEPAFVTACKCLAERGLTLDIFVFYNQLQEVVSLSRAVPGLTIVLDHLGGPITDPRFADEAAEIWRTWESGLRDVAACPNVVIKLGGMGMIPLAGDLWTSRLAPPTSAQHADWMRPYVDHALELFSPARAMFQSNFPTERPSAGYGIVWNSFKRLAKHSSEEDKSRLFFGTANEIYKLKIFSAK